MKKLYLLFFLIGCSNLFSQEYNVEDFGAIGDGNTINTEAIQSLIDKETLTNGGKIVIPKGKFVIGSIILKSNIELHLEKGAELLGSTKPEDYKKLSRWKALILAENQSNIKISGRGTINGRGAQLALHLDSLFYLGKIDSADYNLNERRPKYTIRPQIIEFVNCTNVMVEDITLKNAACWVQTYDRCTELTIENITVESDSYWNNDGIDIIDCKNVRISNSKINSSDDGICLKSSIDNSKLGDYYCENIQINNCKVRSSASAIKLGSRSVGGFKNITIDNIKIYDTFRSAIALETVDGGILQNVKVKNIRAKNVGNAFFIRLGQRYRKSKTPSTIQGVTIENMKVNIANERPDKNYKIKGPDLPYFHNTFPASITGIKGHSLANIHLENIQISYPGNSIKAYANYPLEHLDKIPELERAYPEYSMFGELPAWALYLRHASNIQLKNVHFKLRNKEFRKAIVLDDVQDCKFINVSFTGVSPAEAIYQNNSSAITIED